jgi:ADP-heptose:LPS heptosyltransferase
MLCNLVYLSSLRLRTWLTGRKLVVIGLPGRLGDIVACTPFASRLRRERPRDLIVWAARSVYADVLRGNPDIDAIIPLCCFTDWIWLRKFERLWDRKYDLVIPGESCDKCKHRSGEQNKIWKVNQENYLDFGSLLGAFSRSAGYPVDEGEPLVATKKVSESRADLLQLPALYVCIHAFSEDGSRDWQVRHWNSLIDHINEVYGLCVIEVGLHSALGRGDDDGYHNLCGRTSIAESAEIIRRAVLFIGIDSGPAHLANAVRTPGVLLLGDFERWDYYMPYTGFYTDERNCRIIRHLGPVSQMPLEACMLAVDGLLRERLDAGCDPPTHR